MVISTANICEVLCDVGTFNKHSNLQNSQKITNSSKLEKGFQKKPIVAFTNSTEFILDFNI